MMPSRVHYKVFVVLFVVFLTGCGLGARNLSLEQRNFETQWKSAGKTDASKFYSQNVSGKKYALVIGNSNYNSSPLKNPVRDAEDIATVLSNIGFEVHFHKDLSLSGMRGALTSFSNSIKDQNGMSFFYFAGHGLNQQNENYLLPVNFPFEHSSRVSANALGLSNVMKAMDDGGTKVNVVILDACRVNPYTNAVKAGSRGVVPVAKSEDSVTSGFSAVDSVKGMLIAFATSPGSVAFDGDGKNGVYTKHLLKNIVRPNMSIEKIFKHVRLGVMNETDGQQIPWENSSLTGDVYLVQVK